MTEFVSPVVSSQASFFREEALVVNLLTQCATFCSGDSDGNVLPSPQESINEELAKISASAHKVIQVIETYQEQPAILDASLEVMVTPIMAGFRQVVAKHTAHVTKETGPSSPTQSTAFPFGRFTSSRLIRLSRLLYTICKVRGYKKVVRLFPHEVADLEPVFHLLQAQDTDDHDTWHVRYSLLLWMSIIVIVPFDLQSIDSSVGSTDGPSLVDRIIAVCKMYLRDSGPVRNAAALCLSKLLTRPDMEARHLTEFLVWANSVVAASVPSSDVGDEMAGETKSGGHILSTPLKHGQRTLSGTHQHQQIFLSTGALETLVLVFKHGHRQQMEGRIPAVAECMELATRATASGKASTLQRKLTMKLSQRVGLQYLPPRVAKWRYQRGQRSLLDNMNSAAASSSTAATEVQVQDIELEEKEKDDEEEEDEEDEDEEEVPEETDDVIEVLLKGLRDKDTVVRWSAAKGVGRLTGRLPREYADQVVEEVLELLSDGESDGAWHGGCLALAELARRGLLLPARLGQVAPLVCRAIVYDVRRGKHSIGSHVRDAACYVCWAFARAYEPKEMEPYVEELSRAMMTTALFDREVNCRRAASAAYQENVGRQGHENFPNGIDILTKADYFTLGNRNNAYLEIGPFVASFSLYRRALIDHLADVKIIHWDPSLRALAAGALGRFALLDPSYMIDVVLPNMVEKTLDRTDLLIRHGCALATASLIKALALLKAAPGTQDTQDTQNIQDLPPPLGDELLKNIRNLIPRLEKARLYRGRGGEVMRGAACRIIEAIALAGHPLSRRAQLRLLDTIDECVKHPTVIISEAAADALSALTRQYFPSGNAAEVTENFARMPLKYSTILRTDDNPGARRGFALALGALPHKYVAQSKEMSELVLSTLVACADPKRNALSKGAPDAETRRNAIKSLGRLSGIVLVNNATCTDAQAMQVFEMVVLATQDYETDSRGAVGSWVRRAALDALPKVLCALRFRELPPSARVRTRIDVPFELNQSETQDGSGSNGSGSNGNGSNGSGSNGSNGSGSNATTDTTTMDTASSPEVFRMCSPPVVEKAMCALFCQLASKIDVVREDAGKALVIILTSTFPVIPCIPLKEVLLQLVETMNTKTSVASGGWGIPAIVFPLVVPLIALSPFRTAVLSGLKESIGDINESSAKMARQALLNYVVGNLRKEKQYVSLSAIADSLLAIVLRREGREFESIMMTVSLLLENGAFDFMDPAKSTFAIQLLEAARSTMLKTREYKRIVAGMHVCCALTAFAQPVSGKAMDSILLLLGHVYPIVRKITADKLYSALLQYEIACLPEEETDDTIDEMSDLLLETPWAEGSMTTVMESRDALYGLLNMDIPLKSARDLMMGGGRMREDDDEEKDEFNSFSALAREMHR